jgi:calcineurin-like phosphoesterase family protein
MNYYTADPHFHHTNIIKYCDRPFSDAKIMNRNLIDNWNEVVTDNDNVFVLGDFIFTENPQQISRILKQLKGTKILILGNHDTHFNPFVYVEHGFQSVHTFLQVEFYNGEIFNLVHDPAIATASIDVNPHRWLVGHVHTVFKHIEKRIINVGVDVNNFTPVSEEEIIKCYM